MAGLSRDGWRHLNQGDDVRCCVPWVDRRKALRGDFTDRRREPRHCPGNWGRIGRDFPPAWIRPVSEGQPAAPGPVLHLKCPNKHCQRAHELLVLTVAAKAA